MAACIPGRAGYAHPNITPYDTFATATTPIFLAVGNEGPFVKLCEVIGARGLASDTGLHSIKVASAEVVQTHFARESPINGPCG